MRTKLMNKFPKQASVYYINKYGEKVPATVIGYTHNNTPRIKLMANLLNGDKRITVKPENLEIQE